MPDQDPRIATYAEHQKKLERRIRARPIAAQAIEQYAGTCIDPLASELREIAAWVGETVDTYDYKSEQTERVLYSLVSVAFAMISARLAGREGRKEFDGACEDLLRVVTEASPEVWSEMQTRLFRAFPEGWEPG